MNERNGGYYVHCVQLLPGRWEGTHTVGNYLGGYQSNSIPPDKQFQIVTSFRIYRHSDSLWVIVDACGRQHS